jgi:CheY-like chemotaxis protein
MIVDDESMIREMTSRLLTAFGYRVLPAEDGAGAVSLFARHQGEVAAVVLDLMMPFMDGIQAAHAIHRIDPDVPLIGTTGLPEKQQQAEAEGARFAKFLAKPYTADDLLGALAAVVKTKS